METLGDKIKGKKGTIFYECIPCDFKCCKKYSWDRHLTTAKHLIATECDNLGEIKGKKGQKNTFTCEICNKEYQHRQCLWRHKKTCSFINQPKDDNTGNKLTIDDKDDLIIQLLKQNAKLMEILENGTTNLNVENL
jgi:hypothetical protein